MKGTATQLRELALALGWDECRIAAAAPAGHGAEFLQWLEDGCHGDMAWLAKNPQRRVDPREVLPGAKSLVVLALNYFQGDPATGPGGNEWRMARYAWGGDYHDLILDKLHRLSAIMDGWGGQQRYYVDTGPVLERDFATASGLGWNGKSTVQIHPRLGSWFFLAEIITTLEFPPDASMNDHCGKCTRCIVACPTAAITAPRRLDARRCLSYLTIENKGPIPLEFRRALGNRIYGCDECLAVCPWNRFAQATRESSLHARESVFKLSMREMLDLDDEGFRALFKGSPVKRIKRHGFLRNVCVALGNVGSAEDLPALEKAALDPHPLIREHALWALSEISLRSQV